MPTAYILLNTEIGAKDQVLRALREIEGVEEVHSLWESMISSQTSQLRL